MVVNAQKDSLLSYRLGVFSRILAAVFGCYLLVTLFSIMLAFVMPGGPEKALVVGSHVSFAIYPFGVIWVFAARTATRAWLGLFLLSAPLALTLAVVLFQGNAI